MCPDVSPWVGHSITDPVITMYLEYVCKYIRRQEGKVERDT